ncbi:helix-turn-helix domain-containing protein [Nocardioides cheoyonin]|uniref:helix-turn-helix domain-containing protein n=1 Tax=Nocardioides cheoyonin TaxID=3156615 RepID=UPI0032B53066
MDLATTEADGTGRLVRTRREAAGVSLRQLATRLGVSPATMSAIERGRTPVTVDRLRRIAELLDTPPEELLGSRRRAIPAAASTVASPTGHWRDFAPLPVPAVLQGAIRAFVAVGYHGASMRLIAQLAEMSVPGVYHHVPSKQELLVRVLDLTMDDLIWRLEQARDEGGEGRERLALLIEALALFHARRNDLAFIGASEMRSLEPASYRRIAALRNRVQRMLDEEVESAEAVGVIEPPSPPDAGKAISTMCTSLAQWFHPEGPRTPEEIAAEYSELGLRMLGVRR